MTEHQAEAVTVRAGEAQDLHDTLPGDATLTVSLVSTDPGAGTATLDLHNPAAEPDEMVAGLIEEHEADVESTNEWRDRLHLPEKAVPVDVSTARVERIECTLHEKLLIGIRQWRVTEIAADSVTLIPGHDHETHTLVNEAEDLAYGPTATTLAEDLNTLDEGL
jgi:hypothetical protein